MSANGDFVLPPIQLLEPPNVSLLEQTIQSLCSLVWGGTRLAVCSGAAVVFPLLCTIGTSSRAYPYVVTALECV